MLESFLLIHDDDSYFWFFYYIHAWIVVKTHTLLDINSSLPRTRRPQQNRRNSEIISQPFGFKKSKLDRVGATETLCTWN